MKTIIVLALALFAFAVFAGSEKSYDEDQWLKTSLRLHAKIGGKKITVEQAEKYAALPRGIQLDVDSAVIGVLKELPNTWLFLVKTEYDVVKAAILFTGTVQKNGTILWQGVTLFNIRDK